MAPKPPTAPQFTSDVSGEDIPIGEHAIVRISYGEHLYTLDALWSEVTDMAEAGVKTNKPGRKKAGENGNQSEADGDDSDTDAANTGEDSTDGNPPANEGDNPGEDSGTDEPAKTTSGGRKRK